MLQNSFTADKIEAGCDEVGRGCLAGPVVAAAVILPKKYKHKLLNDSKQVTEQVRLELDEVIKHDALAWAIAEVSPQEIDQINILNASFKAMHLALNQLKLLPELLLIDGNRFNRYKEIPHQCIIEGDGLYTSIAAASILAKTYRDDYMHQLHLKFPHYHWNTNKGYATRAHRDAIKEFGQSEFHRKSFHLFERQLELEFD